MEVTKMMLNEVCDSLKSKHKANTNFQFTMKHDKLEIKNVKEQQNVIIVDATGKFDVSRWYGGSNSNGPFIPTVYSNNPSIESVERILDRLLTIPGSKIDKWRY